jgi:YYY domain-containing protein
MTLLLVVLGFAVPALFLRIPLFYGTVSLMLVTPILWWSLSAFAPSLTAYLLSAGAIWGVCAWIGGLRVPKMQRSLFDEALPLLIFAVMYSALYALSLSWSEFFSMGERMRDYALLHSVLEAPKAAQEPWMAGATLNYYLYWYRLGHMVATFTGAPTWAMYHVLASLPLALLGATIFFLLHSVSLWKPLTAGIVAAFVTLGSNVAGVIAFFTKDDNWWGPSRVIPGAINEFPAWSFLLGDVHPHYLNLPLPLFLLTGSALVMSSALSRGERYALLCSGFFVAPLWFFNSNAWDVPMWIGTAVILVGLSMMNERTWRDAARVLNPAGAFTKRGAAILLSAAVLWISLYLSSRNILPQETEIAAVRQPIEGTSVASLFRHWGAPLVLIGIALPLLLRGPVRWIAVAACGGALIAEPSAVLLYLLFVFNALRLHERRTEQKLTTPAERLFECFGVSTLGLLILPELVFLNDPYGGENERMNTIFKVYAYAWTPFHLFAFSLFREAWLRTGLAHVRIVPVPLAYGITLICFCGFTYRVGFNLRREQRPEQGFSRIEGLAKVEREFQGSASTIRALRRADFGVVLEAQGNAYSWTTHVSTLAGKPAYLGWENHVGLLTKLHDEVARRRDVTEKVYLERDCEEKRRVLNREAIRYVVVGPLERERYPGMDPGSFGCFKKTHEAGLYVLYEAG